MILHFLRHAQAEPFQPLKHQHDSDRPLTESGQTTLRHAARGFLRMGMKFECLVASPYLRAVETSKIIADVFNYKNRIHISENLVPEANVGEFHHEFLAEWSRFNSVLFVTHQPFVSEFIAAILTPEDDEIAIDMGTGTLCTLEAQPSLKGPALLVSLIHAEQAALLGGER